MNILVIGAMPIEVETLIDKTGAQHAGQFFDTDYYTYKLDRENVYIITCGIGKVNATAITQKAIDDLVPEIIINTGIAGSMKRENKIGDTIIGCELTYHDVRQEQMVSCFPYRSAFNSDVSLINEFERINCDNKPKRGKIVSGESFICTTTEKDKIIKDYMPDCVDMESAAIAHVAYINKVRFIVIRTICDNADEKAVIDFEEFEKVNAIASANMVNNFLINLDRVI